MQNQRTIARFSAMPWEIGFGFAESATECSQNWRAEEERPMNYV
jgi:hypothetical protein